MMSDMVFKKEWQEFRDSGLLWWVNSLLHVFGWAIVVVVDEESGEIISSHPARTKFRGFDEKSNTKGYEKVSQYLADNINELLKEAKDEN